MDIEQVSEEECQKCRHYLRGVCREGGFNNGSCHLIDDCYYKKSIITGRHLDTIIEALLRLGKAERNK